MYTDNRHLYLTLFSNSSLTLYSENAVGAFTVEFAQSISSIQTTSVKLGFGNSQIRKFLWEREGLKRHKLLRSDISAACGWLFGPLFEDVHLSRNALPIRI
jgi:hypothetical protein